MTAVLLRRLVMLVALLAVVGAVGSAALPRPETGDERVERIAAELRCPVCQGLAVADSPSETAREMRDLVAQRVAEGRTDDEIRDEFRRSYGDWIFLQPPLLDARGLVWLVPLGVVAIGALVVLLRLGDRGMPLGAEPSADELARLGERVAREEALEG